MIIGGVDVGSRTTCALILKDNDILSYGLINTGAQSALTSRRSMDEALKRASLKIEDLTYIVGSGYGRFLVPFAHEIVTEIWCHARGAHWYFPSVRTILDMGGQDCKGIRVGPKGDHVNFAMNDKCAAGTGRFLEVMAEILGYRLDDIGELSLQSKKEIKISSTCAVFAKSEVAAMVRRGEDRIDILAGLHEAIAVRTYNLLKRVGIEKDFVITGGIAKNIGVVRKLEEKVGLTALIPEEPQIVGALGAALLAREKAETSEGRLQASN
ncbi:MAG: 2-hydroxyglutaryl-CoA dehydratase [Deltaproteobacteria bacterium]|nr:2-hydroxyglutaryl-CoA dehydratase [Deltaproteobacteria bacterium]